MQERARRDRAEPWTRRTSEAIDNAIGIFSPRTAYRRKAYRFGYEAIDRHRTRKKHPAGGGTGDTHLTERSLTELREIARDMSRNNPLANGLLKIERNGIIGSGITAQARTQDDALNNELEAAWKEQMLDQPCDVTGRFNFNQFVRKAFLSYRRDGDLATLFLDDELQAVEGDQIGTPWGRPANAAKNFDVINGVAVTKKERKVIGYYIGKPNKYGYIKPADYQKYPAEAVHLVFDPDRFSQSRCEPVLTPSVNWIDLLTGYIDAEFVAAKVNACFCMFVESDYPGDMMPDPYTKGVTGSGYDSDTGQQHEKIEPGAILYGRPGEKAQGIGQTRPGSLFDPFVLRMLTLIGRPLCMPLMLITMDFSGATFMNARLAYQKVQEEWQSQQDNVVKPFVSRVWRWKLQRLLDTRAIKTQTDRARLFAHEVFCRRWPYVDPFKEAKADEQQMKNGTLSAIDICARQGEDFEGMTRKIQKVNEIRQAAGLPPLPAKSEAKGAGNGNANRRAG
ncbi:MAG: phage portal protein [Planctomycetota bacterium]|jgi:lambda family phage portal protein